MTHGGSESPESDHRLLTLSCGAALHHACVALAAEGFAADVRRTDADGSQADTGPLATGVGEWDHW
jgi:hypothetical protein